MVRLGLVRPNLGNNLPTVFFLREEVKLIPWISRLFTSTKCGYKKFINMAETPYMGENM